MKAILISLFLLPVMVFSQTPAENINDTLVEFRGILAKANNGDSTETYALAYQAVPEPTTICMLVLGGTAVLARRRRRRR